jgi:hypothetical protein
MPLVLRLSIKVRNGGNKSIVDRLGDWFEKA